MFYRLLLILAALVAAVIVYFFLWGLSDGTVDQGNILLWLPLLAVPALILFGAVRLRARGQTLPAAILLLLLALPAILFAIILVVIIVAQPRWN